MFCVIYIVMCLYCGMFHHLKLHLLILTFSYCMVFKKKAYIAVKEGDGEVKDEAGSLELMQSQGLDLMVSGCPEQCVHGHFLVLCALAIVCHVCHYSYYRSAKQKQKILMQQ